MITLEQLLAAESYCLAAPAPAPEKPWMGSDDSNLKIVGVAVIGGKCKDEVEFVFGEGKVDPFCVNASNPFHMCADYCAKRSPGAKMQNGVKSVSVENAVKDVEEKKVDPRCPNSSNPYHVCADYCFERMRETESRRGRKQAASSPRGNGKLMVVERTDVDPNCINASNPFHKCAEYCLEKKMEADSSLPKSEGKSETVERKEVDPNCVNASNPYDKCAEYCFEKKQEVDNQRGRKSAASTPRGNGKLMVVERTDVDPNCINASNPFHKCAEYCLEKKMEAGSPGKNNSDSSLPKSEGKSETVERKDVDPNCVNASNPYHKCAEYCFEKKQEVDNQQGRKSDSTSPKSKGKLNMVERKDVDPNCVNASNPYHKCAEYCFKKKQEMDNKQGKKLDLSSPKSKRNLALVERKDVDPNCINASNPYHKCADYCQRKHETNSQQGRKSVSDLPKSKGTMAILERKDVDPNCPNASNPYHKCAEYCFKTKQETNNQQETKSVSSSLKSKKTMAIVETKDVDPNCVNASNPYHKCAEYCFERKQEMGSQQSRKSDLTSPKKSKGTLATVERKDVDPNCANASNPYHKCAGYCLGGKLETNSQIGRKTDSSSPKKSKGNLAMVKRKDPDPSCVNASNPYHKCAAYCLEKMQETNSQPGRKADSSSPKRSKGNLAMVERKDVDPSCVNASNPYHKCVEYCFKRKKEIDSHQGRKSVSSSPKSKVKLAITERKYVDPNCVNASNPYHKCAEYCLERKQEKGSQQGKKSVSSSPKGEEKLMVLIERKDVNPNCVNASNPFHQCAEYCSQSITAAT